MASKLRHFDRTKKSNPLIADGMLTINEAAKRLKISSLDVRHLLEAKKLAAIQTDGGQWRISVTALQEFIQRGGVQPKGE